MHPAKIIPETTITPCAPRRSSALPTHTEQTPPTPEPMANPMLMDVADQPNSSWIGRRKTPIIGPCIGTLAAAASMLAVITAQP